MMYHQLSPQFWASFFTRFISRSFISSSCCSFLILPGFLLVPDAVFSESLSVMLHKIISSFSNLLCRSPICVFWWLICRMFFWIKASLFFPNKSEEIIWVYTSFAPNLEGFFLPQFWQCSKCAGTFTLESNNSLESGVCLQEKSDKIWHVVTLQWDSFLMG